MNVVDKIKPDICVGCGTCVGICPMQHLEIGYNEHNLLQVKERENKCSDKCNLCISVCPFSDESENEDTASTRLFKEKSNIKYRPECGYYLNSYVGYTPNEERRMESASGGLTSYILEQLLKRGEADAAVVAQRTEGGEEMYSFAICRDAEDIYKYTRSAYYAIHADAVIRQIITDNTIQSVAFVGVPCMCKAIRNACKQHAVLRRKIKYVIGLVCGQQKNHNFAEYLGKKNGIENIKGIDFRTKKKNRRNGNFGVRLKSDDKGKEITFTSFSKDWSFRLFTVQACNYCDDAFAETADAVLMDAWLPEYTQSDKGENLVITRSEIFDEILGAVPTVKNIPIDRVIQSQQVVLDTKRKYIIEPLKELKKREIEIKKREHLFAKISILERYMAKAKYKLSINSDRLWIESGKNIDVFNEKIKPYKRKIFIGMVFNKIYTIIHRK